MSERRSGRRAVRLGEESTADDLGWARRPEPLEEIVLFEVDDRGEFVEARPDEPRSVGETLAAWRDALTAIQANAQQQHAGLSAVAESAQVDFPTRRVFGDNVQVTVLADARDATAIVLDEELIDRHVTGLRTVPESMRTHKAELSWTVMLRTAPWRDREATLRISPSPSFNVTVIRLTPRHARRSPSRAFVRRGLRAATTLVEELERRLDQPGA